ncbi:hypothetical protein AHF37_03395 [Paragonimus kellicotti]|nr:hypothetical protein AHF37_03395 [Paragonimus kellicotti]
MFSFQALNSTPLMFSPIGKFIPLIATIRHVEDGLFEHNHRLLLFSFLNSNQLAISIQWTTTLLKLAVLIYGNDN